MAKGPMGEYIAGNHQVLYFTCQRQHAEEAQAVGANFRELRGRDPQN